MDTHKKVFIKYFKNQDYLVLSNIYDMICSCVKSSKTVYSKVFYTPNIYKPLIKFCNNIGVNVYLSGIFNEYERAMIALTTLKGDKLNFPNELIAIKTKSKFSKISHKDYLGAVMNLGIKREKFGDFIVKNDVCYVAISSDIYSYVQDNLKFINKYPCKVDKLNKCAIELPTYNFEEKIIIVNSNRLDLIVSRIINVSRTKSVSLINNSKVLIDYDVVNDKNAKIKENSIIIVRKYGKFKISKFLGLTQKNKIKIKVKKFI